MQIHIGQLVKDSSTKLKQARGKIIDSKLAKDFQAVIRVFHKAQQLKAERETAYVPIVPQAVPSSSHVTSEMEVSSEKIQQQRAPLEPLRQELLQLDREIVSDEEEQGIQEAQQEIGEINEMIKDLAVLVRDQRPTIVDVEANIRAAMDDQERAKALLEKASKTQRSKSSLACLLLVIFGVALLILIVVLVA